MLTSQLISSEQIAELSRMVVINTANKGNAQAAGAAMTPAGWPWWRSPSRSLPMDSPRIR